MSQVTLIDKTCHGEDNFVKTIDIPPGKLEQVIDGTEITTVRSPTILEDYWLVQKGKYEAVPVALTGRMTLFCMYDPDRRNWVGLVIKETIESISESFETWDSHVYELDELCGGAVLDAYNVPPWKLTAEDALKTSPEELREYSGN